MFSKLFDYFIFFVSIYGHCCPNPSSNSDFPSNSALESIFITTFLKLGEMVIFERMQMHSGPWIFFKNLNNFLLNINKIGIDSRVIFDEKSIEATFKALN